MLDRIDRLQKKLLARLAKALPHVPITVLDFMASVCVTLPACWLAYCFAFTALQIAPGFGKGGVGIAFYPLLLLLFIFYLTVTPLILALPPIIRVDEPIDVHRFEVISVAIVVAAIWTAFHSFQQRKESQASRSRRDIP